LAPIACEAKDGMCSSCNCLPVATWLILLTRCEEYFKCGPERVGNSGVVLRRLVLVCRGIGVASLLETSRSLSYDNMEIEAHESSKRATER
jgi:hypothetical protein